MAEIPDQPEWPEFPLSDLLPKQETGALSFLQGGEEAKRDGRGVVIGILDSGVDPRASGLQVTSDGRRKILNLVDCTGSGDVNMSTIVEAKNGIIRGQVKKSLKVGKLQNPSGKFHVGWKRAFDLWPSDLVSRVKESRKADGEKEHKGLQAGLYKQLAKSEKDKSLQGKEDREDLLEQISQLNGTYSKFDDAGPLFDCVVYHDGSVWRAVIDYNETGDLSAYEPLTDYAKEFQVASFGQHTMLNFTVNIYDEGNLLSIVTTCSSHGTHVASIAAGYHPESPDLNGIAPGAQIVSLKIGDTRLGSMETGIGLTRALTAAIDNKCDIINMSYGEASKLHNSGRFVEMANILVQQHGIIFVSSAGNGGPALSTLSSPGGTSTSIIGVGAYVGPALMKIAYHLLDELPETSFTWSSRGPSFDGHLGVCVSAPGGAIASVPEWTLSSQELKNGTSMAAPNTSGSIALLLSALRSEKLSFSPVFIRRALENTARQAVGEVEKFALGNGLIQVPAAHEYLVANNQNPLAHVRFDVGFAARGNARGLYLRAPRITPGVYWEEVSITPVFPKTSSNETKVAFELRASLESGESWIQTPPHVVMSSEGKSFSFRLDTSNLPVGAHYGEIRGHDITKPGLGPLFRIPITVVIPQELPSNLLFEVKSLQLEPAVLQRYFLNVPEGVSWVTVQVTAHEFNANRRFVMHSGGLYPHSSHRERMGARLYFTLASFGSYTKCFPLVGGVVWELCFGQFWSSLGSSTVDLTVTFHGLGVSNQTLILNGSDCPARIDLHIPFGPEEIVPSGSLTALRRSLRPEKTQIKVLPCSRDRIPDGRQLFELTLFYPFKLSENGTVNLRCPVTNGLLYDSVVDSVVVAVYDKQKRFYFLRDTFSKSIKLEKGDYTAIFQICHEDVETLEKLKSMVLFLDSSLPKSIPIEFYPNANAAVIQNGKWKPASFQKGERIALFATCSIDDKLPKDSSPGNVLLGTVKYAKKSETFLSEEGMSGHQVYCHISPKKTSKSSDSGPSEKKSQGEQQMADAIRDIKLSWLKKLKKGTPEFDELLKSLSAELAQFLPFLLLKLELVDDGESTVERFQNVIQVADQIIALIDTNQIALFYGMNQNLNDEKVKNKKIEVDLQKDALLEAIFKKLQAYLTLEELSKNPKKMKERNDKSGSPRQSQDLDAEGLTSFLSEPEASPSKNTLPTEPSEILTDFSVGDPSLLNPHASSASPSSSSPTASPSPSSPSLPTSASLGQVSSPRQGQPSLSPSSSAASSPAPASPVLSPSATLAEISSIDLEIKSTAEGSPVNYSSQIEELWEQCKLWVDISSDPRFLNLKIRQDLKKKKLGATLKGIQKFLSLSNAKPQMTEKVEKMKIEVLSALKWKAALENEQKWAFLKNPPDYQPL